MRGAIDLEEFDSQKAIYFAQGLNKWDVAIVAGCKIATLSADKTQLTVPLAPTDNYPLEVNTLCQSVENKCELNMDCDYSGECTRERIEKRRHPRQPTDNHFVQSRLVKSAFVDAAENLSEGGIFIAADKPLPLHSPIEVLLTDGRPEPFVLSGKVVRVVWKTQGPVLKAKPEWPFRLIQT